MKPFSELIGKIIEAGGLFKYKPEKNYHGKTLFEKIWDAHLVFAQNKKIPLHFYIDRHLVHEVTSPQAFDGLRMNDRKVRRPDLPLRQWIITFQQMTELCLFLIKHHPFKLKHFEKNCKDFGIKLFDINSPNQGIVHVIGPQLGITLPGATIVCGDSHTSTHGAFGSLHLELEQVK